MGTDLTKLQWKEITDSVVLEIGYGKTKNCIPQAVITFVMPC